MLEWEICKPEYDEIVTLYHDEIYIPTYDW